MKVVIIGGVAGGATAAARLRRLNEEAEIVMLERSGYVSYANCGLPYYIGGTIQNEKALTLQTPESFKRRFNVRRPGAERSSRHPPGTEIGHRPPPQRRHHIRGKLRQADPLPGAKPVRPGLPGINHERIFTLRSVEDTFFIHRFVEENAPKTAVVVGGGFIGLEMAENLTHLGLSVTVVERLNQVMSPIDYDMACGVHAYLKDKGINLLLSTSVEGFEPQGSGLRTLLSEERFLDADMVILAIGVTPETQLAKEAGLRLGQRGSIAVNDRMETSDPDIYAVGDAVEVRHFVTGTETLIPLAGPANKQGRIAADNICGRQSRYKGSQGSSVLKLFDMTVAATGINEDVAKKAGIKYDKVITFTASHATYYPGASNMTVKTLFDPQGGKILGAQIVGFEGVDKRIDVLATAIRAGMTVYDLEELELSYAPPTLPPKTR